MKVSDILTESIDFTVSKLVKEKDGSEYVTAVGSRQNVDCHICDGKGFNVYDGEKDECGMCDGPGKLDRFVNEGPSMTLSNGNAYDLMRHLGLEADYTGAVEGDELTALRQRLIKLLNSDKDRAGMEKATIDNEDERQMGATGQRGNVTSIGRQGARMIDVGRTPEQVKQYAKTMLDMVDYAMKNDYFIGWG